MRVEIKVVLLEELKADANFQHVLQEYAAESALDGLPDPCAQMETYRALEEAGAMEIVAVYAGGVMAGLASVLLSPLPHYGVKAGITESLFVLKEYRKRGLGLQLLRAAENNARGRGAHALLVSSPTGGSLERVLNGLDSYRQTNSVFMRGLK